MERPPITASAREHQEYHHWKGRNGPCANPRCPEPHPHRDGYVHWRHDLWYCAPCIEILHAAMKPRITYWRPHDQQTQPPS